MPGHTCGTSQSVLLNESCHKKHEYIRFRGGDLYSFQNIKPLIK